MLPAPEETRWLPPAPVEPRATRCSGRAAPQTGRRLPARRLPAPTAAPDSRGLRGAPAVCPWIAGAAALAPASAIGSAPLIARRLQAGVALHPSVQTPRVAHEIQWAALGLAVEPANVLSDDPQRDELGPTQKEDGNDQGRPAGDPALGEEPHRQGIQDGEQSHAG